MFKNWFSPYLLPRPLPSCSRVIPNSGPFIFLMLCLGLVCLDGCKRPFVVPKPAGDEAFISEHLIEGTDGWDYVILEIDGRPVRREIVAFGVDLDARAVVGVGEHTVKVSRQPHGRTGHDVVEIKDFRDTVVGGREYFIGTKDGVPRLIEFPTARTRE